jgi:stress response protein YsnF
LDARPSSPNLQACRNRNENVLRSPRQQPRQVGLAQVQRQLAQILAIKRQDVEGIELHLVIMLSRVQAVEIGDAVDTEQHRLAVDDERRASVSQGGLDDQRVTIAPVVTVAGEQNRVSTASRRCAAL